MLSGKADRRVLIKKYFKKASSKGLLKLEKVFELESKAEILIDLRRELRSLLRRAGWNGKPVDEIVLSVDEALTNVIRHAYPGVCGPIRLIFRDSEGKTEIVIEDYGKKFDPTLVPEPEFPREQPGGLGVHLIRTIMDELSYDKNFLEGNRLCMIKRKSQ